MTHTPHVDSQHTPVVVNGKKVSPGIVRSVARNPSSAWSASGITCHTEWLLRCADRIEQLERENAELLAVAKAYEAWEADVVISGDWSLPTVRLTQAQHDRLIEIQSMRNAVLAKVSA